MRGLRQSQGTGRQDQEESYDHCEIDVTYRIEDKKGKRTVVNGERLITFVKPGDWSSTDGAEDEPREHEIPTSVDSESGDDQPDVRPEKENSQRTSGRRERRAPQRYGCE